MGNDPYFISDCHHPDYTPDGKHRLTYYMNAKWEIENGDRDYGISTLEMLCSSPNIYKGHYRLLFIQYRLLNKSCLADKYFATVRDRVLNMIQMDNEMIDAMLDYWSEIQKIELSKGPFNSDRNLKLTDARALFLSAQALNDKKSLALASMAIRRFKRKLAK